MKTIVKDIIKYIEFLYRSGVDAVIMQDLGAMDLVRQRFPKLEIHASTQMNIHSLESVKLLERLGIKRAVLSRELSINDIFNIKAVMIHVRSKFSKISVVAFS